MEIEIDFTFLFVVQEPRIMSQDIIIQQVLGRIVFEKSSFVRSEI